MIAVILVRDGVPPAGADEAISESGGAALFIGSGTRIAGELLEPFIARAWLVETEFSAPNVIEALTNAAMLDHSLIFPASPDGRDLAPHVAHQLRRDYFGGAITVTDQHVSVARQGGLAIADFAPTDLFVATLQIGIRGADRRESASIITTLDAPTSDAGLQTPTVTSIAVLPPDASTMDLSEAPRIIGGGAGLDGGPRFEQLQTLATALDASMGVTRVVTDRGWADHERQIGTTGVVVDPDLYISFGVSGAVQHTSGLGQPDHIISVNTDAHCPMMQMSDLAIVADANAVLEELSQLVALDQQAGAA